MENVQNWCESSCHEVPLERFANECTRSTPLDPKLMFWCVSYYLGAFGAVFCPTTLIAKRVNWCNCSCHKVALEFFATNAPDPPHWSLNSCFGVFCTIWVIWYRLVTLQNLVQNRLKWCKTSCHEIVSEFFTTNHSIHPIGP